jgi:hypothetical protein
MSERTSRPSPVARSRAAQRGTLHLARAVLAAALFAAAASCAQRDAVEVRMQALPRREVMDPRLTITAQVAGPTAGLRYKWFAVSGQCNPQQSDTVLTEFTFANGTDRDRITLEVWRGDKRVGRGELDVQLDPARSEALAARPAVQITITKVPPYEPHGGPNTRADIAGRVTGKWSPGDVVILYARADLWYRQPLGDATIPIQPDGTWSSWTHTGSSYAALLVRQDADFFGRFDVLPVVGGLVVARTIVEGTTK